MVRARRETRTDLCRCLAKQALRVAPGGGVIKYILLLPCVGMMGHALPTKSKKQRRRETMAELLIDSLAWAPLNGMYFINLQQ